jgi:hypothetical protein
MTLFYLLLLIELSFIHLGYENNKISFGSVLIIFVYVVSSLISQNRFCKEMCISIIDP